MKKEEEKKKSIGLGKWFYSDPLNKRNMPTTTTIIDSVD